MTQAEASESGIPMRKGERVAGKYRVERVLGEGGMGIVVAATHLALDHRVALKFLRRDAIPDSEAYERFRKEARVAAKLKSEHVARVLDWDTLPTGLPFIVIEYLEGRDLARMLEEQGPLEPAAAVDLMLQTAEAIAEAHAKGIVHRDLKPANIFLARRDDGSECVKLLDFGIAKLFEPHEDTSVTDTRAVLGSVRYMAPEQLRSARAVTNRADIWAFGVVLYELLGGTPPFDQPSGAETSAAVLNEEPADLQSRCDVPAELAAAVHACLAKHPAERPASIGELAERLAPFGSDAARASLERIRRWRAKAVDDATLDGADARPATPGSDADRTGAPSSVQTRQPRASRHASLWVAAAAAAGSVVLVAVLSARPAGEPQLPAQQSQPAPSGDRAEAPAPASTVSASSEHEEPSIAPPVATPARTAPRTQPAPDARARPPAPEAAASSAAVAQPSAGCPDPLCARK